MIGRILYCIFVSGAGGCFVAGRKWRGVAALLAVTMLPFFTLISYSLLSGFVAVGAERYLFSSIFVVSFLFVWVFLGNGAGRCIRFGITKMSLGAMFASSFFWAMALLGWFFCVAQPLLSKDSGPGEVDVFSWDSQSATPVLSFERKEISPGKGNVVFVGAVVDGSGKPVSNHNMTLIFNNYELGAKISTDVDGRFFFRMPPGIWRFDGLYAGESEFTLVTKSGGIGLGESVFVDKEGQDKLINIRIELN